jgi:hypothetical protein
MGHWSSHEWVRGWKLEMMQNSVAMLNHPEVMHQMAIKRRAIRLCRAIIYGPSVWRCTGAPLEVPNPNRFLCPPFRLRQGRVRERWESPRVAFLVAAKLFPRSQWIHCEPGIGGSLFLSGCHHLGVLFAHWLCRVESKAGRFGLFVDRGGFWTSSKILGPLGNIAGWGKYEEFDDYPKGKSKGKAMKGAPKMPKVCEDQNISRKNDKKWKTCEDNAIYKSYISIYKAHIQYYTIIIIIISK